MSNFISKIPNSLTILRVALIPVFIFCLEFGNAHVRFFAFILFIIGAVTDYADGYIARKYSVISDFGKLLDPVADKILVMSALVALVGEIDMQSGKSFIPAWLVVLILARETWVTGLRLVSVRDGIVVAADTLGKYKTATQMIGIIICLLSINFNFIFGTQNSLAMFNRAVGLGEIGLLFLLISLILSYISGYQYTVRILGATK
jgi:CDP-diacylglycerol--glycerol-3-phosphate 3-phosphatidyltransferase